MPNVAKVLKDEMSRVSRRETKIMLAPVQKPVVRMRKDIAALKRSVAALERELKMLRGRTGGAAVAPLATATGAAAPKARITSKGLKSLRRRLHLTQAELAALTNVTPQAVYLWERKNSGLRLRDSTLAAILPLRGLGAREAHARLKPAPSTKRRGGSSR